MWQNASVKWYGSRPLPLPQRLEILQAPRAEIGHRALTTLLVDRYNGGDPFEWLTFDLVPPAVVVW